MPNFKDINTINQADYLPEVLKKVVEMKAIQDAETPTIKEEWQAIEDLMDDQFILTATEKGIARREKPLGITPKATDTLADRRMRLLTLYNENVPYTRTSLKLMLNAICGAEGYSIDYPTNFSVLVRVALTVKKQQDIVDDLLERVLPYDMIYTVSLKYNRWSTVKTVTWGAAKTKTWAGVKEDVLS